ncbi:hypothetical protein IF090_11690 [Acinetobacter towneri]|uniref:hypothetical protein n=1 Tax=Acinetobacter towneri TaxID=202956 RepID=UPI001CE1C68E|nr:hypothetical protein [Acinetobacter towneri]MCA4780286.1 hypothetical protein [Acinetobacter towneri]MCA4785656.1 hypothetical protein [Acinetobacter towneri]MCA4787510.1 hypothetical protein [Acinetobacter towneri]MCA4796792.1 hypothetical protein [Acinetobacter towneri]MCA4801839.1 hypothetical protein [Acinetobacter towneri]
MKFLKIGNAILNIAQIECVTENLVTVGYVDNDDSPFGKAIKEVKGIQVYMIDASSQGGCFVFENETIESFYEKLVAA